MSFSFYRAREKAVAPKIGPIFSIVPYFSNFHLGVSTVPPLASAAAYPLTGLSSLAAF